MQAYVRYPDQTAQYTSILTASTLFTHAPNLAMPQTVTTSPSLRSRTNSPLPVPRPRPCSSKALPASESGLTSSRYDQVTTWSTKSREAVRFFWMRNWSWCSSGWSYL